MNNLRDYACDNCHSNEVKVLHRDCKSRRTDTDIKFDILQCRNCGLGMLYPKPSDELINHVYAQGYQSHITPKIANGWFYKAIRNLCLLPYRLRFGFVNDSMHPWGEKRLLDVGCGVGEYLEKMDNDGWCCFGCDVSQKALAVTRERIPHSTLFCSRFEDLTLPDASFEAISFQHAFEHLESPVENLKRAYKLLTRKGHLVIALPNIDSPEARLFGKRWMEIDIPGHLYFFSDRTLRSMLEKIGFTRIKIRPQFHPSTVSDVLGFMLDDFHKISQHHERRGLYYAVFPFMSIAYAAGNWGCIEIVAVKE